MGICPAIYIPGYKREWFTCLRERENLRAAFSRFANLKLSAFAPIFFTMNLRRTFNHVASLPPQARECKNKNHSPISQDFVRFFMSWAVKGRRHNETEKINCKNDVGNCWREMSFRLIWRTICPEGFPPKSMRRDGYTHTYKYKFDV
jgi:hypothetical protein